MFSTLLQRKERTVMTLAQLQAGRQEPPTVKLEAARGQITRALADLIPIEGRVLDFDTAEAVYRRLGDAQRQLRELAVVVAVMERRASA
jgi:hypothetical protein